MSVGPKRTSAVLFLLAGAAFAIAAAIDGAHASYVVAALFVVVAAVYWFKP